MFCPKCGTENPDANKYCRACREGLLIVAQAMKKRLPVMIVSKLDAALERSSERFRRDSILFLIFGVGMLITTAVDFRWRHTSWIGWRNLFLTLFWFFGSGSSYLIYKRSLTLGERLQSGQLGSGPDLSGTDSPKPKLQILFCPGCGAKAAESLKHCRACGANLQAVRGAIEPSRWRLALNSRFDSFIERANDKSKIPQNARSMFYVAWIFLVVGIFNIYIDYDPAYLLFSLMFFVVAFWDRAASRRWFPIEEKRGDESQVALTDLMPVPTTKELALLSVPATSPMSITEETTCRLEPVIVQSQEEAETRKL